jgi:type I restriction enzyme S subunit
MNIVGPPLGQVSVVPDDFDEWNINQAIAIFRPIAGVSAQFVCAALLSSPIQTWLKKRAKTTAGQTNLTLEVCRTLPLPLPPVSEQDFLLEVLGSQIEEQSRQSRIVEHSLKQSAAQRKNILKAAFTGQLVPQDPNDEPASVLLERIRTERATSVTSKRERKPRITA